MLRSSGGRDYYEDWTANAELDKMYSCCAWYIILRTQSITYQHFIAGRKSLITEHQENIA